MMLAADNRVSKYSFLPSSAFLGVYGLSLGNGIAVGRRYSTLSFSSDAFFPNIRATDSSENAGRLAELAVTTNAIAPIATGTRTPRDIVMVLPPQSLLTRVPTSN